MCPWLGFVIYQKHFEGFPSNFALMFTHNQGLTGYILEVRSKGMATTDWLLNITSNPNGCIQSDFNQHLIICGNKLSFPELVISLNAVLTRFCIVFRFKKNQILPFRFIYIVTKVYRGKKVKAVSLPLDFQDFTINVFSLNIQVSVCMCFGLGLMIPCSFTRTVTLRCLSCTGAISSLFGCVCVHANAKQAAFLISGSAHAVLIFLFSL